MRLFQILLWALLFVPFAGLWLGLATAGIAYIALAAALCFKAFSFKKSERAVALAFAVTYAIVSAALTLSLAYNWPLFASIGAALACWLALFIYLRACRGYMEAEVLGFDGGYAIVRVEPSIVSWVSPGVYAAESKRVKKGRKVRVRFDWFTKKGFVE